MSYQEVLILGGILAAVFFLGSSSFFSGSETALVSLSPEQAKLLALQNPRFSQLLMGWVNRPHELLILILIGNTFSTVLFATVVTAFAVKLFHTLQPSVIEAGAWLLETIIIVILGDMGPKFYARAHPEKVSLWVLPILERLRIFFSPLFFLLGNRTDSSPFTSVPTGRHLTFSLSELKTILEETAPVGEVSEESVDMMQRALDIQHKTARDIMTPYEELDIIELSPKGKPPRNREDLIDRIIENGHTRTPILIEGKIQGFLHADDLLPLTILDDQEPLRDKIRHGMRFPETRLVSELLQDFQSSGVYAGFVEDPKGKVLGLVTLEDVLEEITGEILDEYDFSDLNGEGGAPS